MRQIAKTVLLRLTAQEYAHLQETSKIAGLKIEPMIRKLIMGEKLRPHPPDVYTDLLRELSAIGNNINQIAYWANAQKGITDTQVEDAVALVNRAWRLIKETL